MVRCSRCLEEKSPEDFHKDSRAPSGRRCYCKNCAKRQNASQWAKHAIKRRAKKASFRTENPEIVAARMRNYKLRSAYGITVAQFEQMLDEQDGKCAICRTDLVQARKGGASLLITVTHQAPCADFSAICATRALAYLKTARST